MHLPAYLVDLTHPLSQGFALLTAGLLCLCVRRYRIAVAFALFGVLWVALCATPAFAEVLRSGLEAPYPAYQPDGYPNADAIVVLGGGDPPDFDHGDEKANRTRTGLALLLYRAQRAPIILVSGGVREGSEILAALERQGVPASALRIEPNSVTTYQNAAYSAPILNREHRHRILLVTSAIPMRRTVASFEKQGFAVIPAPVFDTSQYPIFSAAWRPRISVLFQSQRYLHEYIGMLVYKLRGWI